METAEIDNRAIDELKNHSLDEETYAHKRAIKICQLISNIRKFYDDNALTNIGTSFEFALWKHEAEKLYDFIENNYGFFDETQRKNPRIEPMNTKTVFALAHELRRLYEDTIKGM